ncbi:MAG TPA: hypothetical protein VFZ89_18815 [Solirubrobacteraceae bacterium]
MSRMIAALAVLLALPASARAAEQVTVAALPDGTTLTANLDAKQGLCLRVKLVEEEPSCDRVPLIPREAVSVVTRDYQIEDGPIYVAAAVSDDVAAIELVAHGVDAQRLATTPPARAVPGVDGVRYAFVATTLGRAPEELRLLAGDGRVLGVVADPGHLAHQRDENVRRMARLRGRLELVAFERSRLAPTPLDPARHETLRCVGVRNSPTSIVIQSGLGTESSALTATACGDPARTPTFDSYGWDQVCRVGLVITGVVSPQVRRVIVERADGSHTNTVVRPLLRDPLARGMLAVVVPPRLALRRLRLVDAVGRTIGRLTIREPSTDFSCANDGATVGTGFGVVGDAVARSGPLTVADGPAERLCASLGPLRPGNADCALPPMGPEDAIRSFARRDRDGWTVSGFTLPEGAAVTVRFSDGDVVSAPAARAIPGYGGRYAGAVPFFEVHHPGPARPGRLSVLDARGRRLAGSTASLSRPRPRLAGPLRRRMLNGVRLALGAVRADGATEPCVAFSAARFAERCLPTYGSVFWLQPHCAPRRTLAAIELRGRIRSAAIVDARGHTHHLTTVLRIAGKRIAIAVLGPRVRPTALVLRGARTERKRVRIASAHAQCGYIAPVFPID